MAVATKQNQTQTQKNYSACKVPGHYVCWLGAIWVRDHVLDNGQNATDATITYRIIDGPEGGKYLYDHYRLSTEKGAEMFENTLKKLVPDYYHDPKSDWEAEISEVKEIVSSNMIVVNYLQTEEGYDRVYFCASIPMNARS